MKLGGARWGAVLEHLQLNFANDDDFEFEGGTVNAHDFVSWRSLVYTLVSDFGRPGRVRFAYNTRMLTTPPRSTSRRGLPPLLFAFQPAELFPERLPDDCTEDKRHARVIDPQEENQDERVRTIERSDQGEPGEVDRKDLPRH